jgi:outer membrane protein OmpA-like peptidoglycan-associated protein
MKNKIVKSCLILAFLFGILSPLSGKELWFSIGSGVGLLPGAFSSVSLLNIDGTVGLGIHRMFNTPLRSDLEITYAGYLASEESADWMAGIHGLQGVFLLSFHGAVGKSFVLTPRAGIGMQFLFTSTAATYDDYQSGTYTDRFGTQLLIQGGLAADFLLSEAWALGLEGDYRMHMETDGLHHGALIKLVLNRKITDFKKRTKPAVEQYPADTPVETVTIIDLSTLQGIDNIRAFQTGNRVTIILLNSFLPYESVLTEQSQDNLVLVGEVISGIPRYSAGFYGYVADVQEDEAELDSELSLSRAVAVREWLVSNGYVGNLMTTITEGRSSSNPIGDNSTPEGRGLNRRVEIIIDIE